MVNAPGNPGDERRDLTPEYFKNPIGINLHGGLRLLVQMKEGFKEDSTFDWALGTTKDQYSLFAHIDNPIYIYRSHYCARLLNLFINKYEKKNNPFNYLFYLPNKKDTYLNELR